MTARKKGGAKAPPICEPAPKPAPLDPEARWREFEARTATIAEAMRQALGLGPDVDMTRYAQRYAMAAMTGERSPPWPERPPTEAALKSELLRVEKAARAVLAGDVVQATGNLICAVKALSRDGQRALPEALFLLAEMPAPDPDSLHRLARNAEAAAAIIPDDQRHRGGGRPANIDADLQAVLLAQDFASLMRRPAVVNRRADPAPGSYELLVCEVFRTIGIAGDARKAAERASRRLRKADPAKSAGRK